MSNPEPPHGRAIQRLTQPDEAQLQALAGLLVDCVAGGASISFMHPLALPQALDFWRKVADEVRRGDRALLVGHDAQGLCGSVQLMLAQPPNQPHRADLAKMLVHRRARRRGFGEALMRAAEALARDCGKSLLVLDTVVGSAAERLYGRLGWQSVGIIPGYALLPEGGLCDTHYFYRDLRSLSA